MISKRITALIAASVLSILMLGGCGTEVKLSIKDQNTASEVTVTAGKTVADALKEAGLELGEKDEVFPSADTKITEDMTDITIGRYAKITIADGDETTEAEVVGGTVNDALEAAGITLGELDILTGAAREDPAEDGMKVEIIRRKLITVAADGNEQEFLTEAETVQEFLDGLGLYIGEDDIIEPAPDTVLENGDTVTVKRVTYEERTITEDVPAEPKEESGEPEKEQSEMTQEGEKGKKETVVRIKYIDGEEAGPEPEPEESYEPSIENNEQPAEYNEPSVQYNEPPAQNNEPPAQNNEPQGERYVVFEEDYPSCDDGSHGVRYIIYSDGTEERIEY